MSRYRMASWSSSRQCWEWMDEGAAASHWKPRVSLHEACAKCWAWTGGLGIPPMQVVDTTTGVAVWRLNDHRDESDELVYPRAGLHMTLMNEGVVRGMALHMLATDQAEQADQVDDTEQEALF